MRVTNSMMIANMMRNISKNQNRMDKLQQNMATGKKFLNPSDDPIGVSRSLRLNTDVSIMEQYKRNVDDAGSWMTTTELATNNMISVLQRARELTVQAANGSNTVEERGAIAAEIKELKEQLINIGNTSYAGRYIFSGYKTDQKLLNADGTYDLGGSSLNSNEVIAFNVGIGEKLGVNTVGQRIYGYAVNEADLDKGISTGIVDNILKGENPYASYTVPAGGEILNFKYNGTDYAITVPAGVYGTTSAMADALSAQFSADPALKGHVRATAEDGAINFISDEKFSIPGPATALITALQITQFPKAAVKAAYSLEGASVDLTANSISVTAASADFKLSYGGADYPLSLTAPCTYDGAGAGETLDDLVGDIQDKINANGALKDHVTVANVNNRVVFYSDSPVALKNITPTISFDVTDMGMINNKSSAALDKKVDSGASTQLIGVFDQLIEDLQSDNGNGIGAALTRIDIHMGNISAIRAELGVKSNRIELTTNRIEDDTINLNDLLAKNEDADMAEVIMNLKSEENVYNASLSVGARIIQPSLIDFLR